MIPNRPSLEQCNDVLHSLTSSVYSFPRCVIKGHGKYSLNLDLSLTCNIPPPHQILQGKYVRFSWQISNCDTSCCRMFFTMDSPGGRKIPFNWRGWLTHAHCLKKNIFYRLRRIPLKCGDSIAFTTLCLYLHYASWHFISTVTKQTSQLVFRRQHRGTRRRTAECYQKQQIR